MTETEKQLVNLIELEARKRYKSVRQFCIQQGINPATFSQYTTGARDPKLSTFLTYLRKLDIRLEMISGFDNTKTKIVVSDQLGIFDPEK